MTLFLCPWNINLYLACIARRRRKSFPRCDSTVREIAFSDIHHEYTYSIIMPVIAPLKGAMQQYAGLRMTLRHDWNKTRGIKITRIYSFMHIHREVTLKAADWHDNKMKN